MKPAQPALRPNHFKLTVALLAFSLMAMLTGLRLAAPAQADSPPPTPTGKPSVVGGQALWSQNCLPCHGPTGHGDGPTAAQLPNPIANFTSPTVARNYVPAQNFDVIKNGRMDKMMPPWKNKLSDDDIWNAVAYVWRLGTSPQELAAGEKIYTARCAACHGADGNGHGPQAPAGGSRDFTNPAQMSQLSQANLLANYRAGSQHAQIAGLSEDDLWAALAYIRTFSLELPARTGKLTGQVTNHATGQPVGNIKVALHAFQNGAQIETFTGVADANGKYSFDQLLTDHTIMYMVEGLYQNVGYVSQEPGMFLPDAKEVTLNLEVYDTTTSPAAIGVTQMHYLLSFNPGQVNVLQIYIIGNHGDKTYIGQNGQTFAFTLPAAADSVRFQNDDGRRFIKTAAGYADTQPVLPGDEGLTVAASYAIPFSGDTAAIDFTLPQDVQALDVLMTNQGATLTSQQVDFVENRQFQGNSFAVFNRKKLTKGQTVTLNLSGLNSLTFPAAPDGAMPGAVAPAPLGWFDQNWAKWIILGLGALAIVLAAAVYPRTRLAAADNPQPRRQKLLLLLARLDEVYENGELDEEVYRRARAQYKTELAEIMEQTGQ